MRAGRERSASAESTRSAGRAQCRRPRLRRPCRATSKRRGAFSIGLTSSRPSPSEPGRITRPLLTAGAGATRRRGCASGCRRRGFSRARTRSATSPAGAARRRLLIGSHLDSVADAGRYDGILGHPDRARSRRGAAGRRRSRSIAFADEDGLRFQSIYLGSRAFVGELESTICACATATASRCGEALAGCARPAAVRGARARATSRSTSSRARCSRPRAWPLGVVTAIAGQSRFNLAFDGPRRARRHDPDAPAPRRRRRGRGVRARRRARGATTQPGLVATVGEIGVPHAEFGQRDPGRAQLMLDTATTTTPCALRAIAALRAEAEAIRQAVARYRHPRILFVDREHGADAGHSAVVEQVARRGRGDRRRGAPKPPRSAGHDAATMASVSTDVVMSSRAARAAFNDDPDEVCSPRPSRPRSSQRTDFARALNLKGVWILAVCGGASE